MSTLISLNVENNSDVNVYNQIIILKFLNFLDNRKFKKLIKAFSLKLVHHQQLNFDQ